MPDYNPRIKEIDGRLFPFGFLKLLSKKHNIKRVRLISTNVVPEFQKWGIGIVLLVSLIPKGLDMPTPQGGGASNTLVSQLFPAVHAVYQASNRDQALMRCLRILNALQDYLATQGHEANSLTDLSLSPQATIDPFSGAALKLKKTPTGWIIYSVMNNGVDDNGDFKDMKDWGLAPAGSGHDKSADDGGDRDAPQ